MTYQRLFIIASLCLSYSLFAQPILKFNKINQYNPYLFEPANIEYYGSIDNFEYFGINSIFNKNRFIGKFDESAINNIEFAYLSSKQNIFSVVYKQQLYNYYWNYKDGKLIFSKATQEDFKTSVESEVYEYQVNILTDVSLMLLHSISPDKTKYCIVFMLLDKEKKMIDLFTFVLDNNDNILWEKDIDNEFNFNDKSTFQYLKLIDLKINNNADILLQINNYSNNGCYYNIWRQLNFMNSVNYFFLQKNSLECVSKSIDTFDLSSYKNIVLNNGNFLIANTLRYNKHYKNVNEMTIFLPTGIEIYKNLSSSNSVVLPSSIEKYKYVYASKKSFSNNICDIIEKPNGNIILIYDHTIFSMEGSHMYISININLANYSPKLELLDSLTIPHALSGFDNGIPSINKSGNSIFSYFDGTNIYLLYNEKKRNFKIPQPTKWVLNENIFWISNAIVLTKIDDNLNYKSFNLLKEISSQHTLKGLLFNKNNKLYIFDNKNNIGEIVLENL